MYKKLNWYKLNLELYKRYIEKNMNDNMNKIIKLRYIIYAKV